jgi:hypothetical protein
VSDAAAELVAIDRLGARDACIAGAFYGESKIAFGLFAMELDRRSRGGGWDITSNLAHSGVAPTNLLAARPVRGTSAADPASRSFTPVCEVRRMRAASGMRRRS